MRAVFKRHWPWFKKVVSIVYLAIVLTLIVRLAQKLDWSKVAESVLSLPGSTLAVAASLALSSHVVYSSFDLLGRRLTGHRLEVVRTMLITFVSYVGNLNFGSVIGAVGLRQRLYSRFGLTLGTVVRIAVTSMATNWLGYSLLAAVLLIGPVYAQFGDSRLPGPGVARALGIVLIVFLSGYLALTVFKPGRCLRIGRLQIIVPSPGFALTQFAISVPNWLLISATIYVLLDARIGFEQVLFALLVAAIAGVITHVPAGLGVIEAGFLLLLGDQMNREELLGALLAYRVVYYLLPLVPAAIVWLWMESNA